MNWASHVSCSLLKDAIDQDYFTKMGKIISLSIGVPECLMLEFWSIVDGDHFFMIYIVYMSLLSFSQNVGISLCLPDPSRQCWCKCISLYLSAEFELFSYVVKYIMVHNMKVCYNSVNVFTLFKEYLYESIAFFLVVDHL